jgi:hypothetical protein
LYILLNADCYFYTEFCVWWAKRHFPDHTPKIARAKAPKKRAAPAAGTGRHHAASQLDSAAYDKVGDYSRNFLFAFF